MTDELLSDRDAQVWDAVGGESSEFEANGQGTIEVSEHLLASIVDRLDALERRLERVEDRSGDGLPEDAPVLLHYANIPEEERAELLHTIEQVAVALHEQWADIAWTLGGGSNAHGQRAKQRIGVDTKSKANAKHNPSRIKHRIKTQLGFDLQSTEVYRSLKRLAELSGGEKKVNQSDGRVHVAGGLYEFREQATADGQDTRRVLWRATE